MKLTPIEPNGDAFAHAVEVRAATWMLFTSGQVPEDESGGRVHHRHL